MISVEIELNYSCYHVAPFDLSNLSTWEDLQFWQDQLASNKIQTSGILLWSWVWPRANPRCPIYNILSHDIIWYRTWVVLCPSFHIMSERTCRWRSNWTYSATASDHPMGTINAQVHKKKISHTFTKASSLDGLEAVGCAPASHSICHSMRIFVDDNIIL